MKITSINAGNFKLDGGAMHGVVPKSLWQQHNPADEQNMCSWAMRCLLVEQGDKLILIDTGIGDKQDAKFFGHYYLHGDDALIKNIEKSGYSTNDITDVFLTHLHFDHVGGAISRVGEKLVPTFANATYWSNERHWDWAVHPNAREKASFLKENILPIQESGQLQFVTAADGEEWIDGFRIKLVDGHTEQMMLPLIEYKGQKILYCADLIPSKAHIPLPWIMAYDMRPLDTLTEKTRLLQEAADGDYLLFFEHDYTVSMCSLEATDRGVRARDVLRIEDL